MILFTDPICSAYKEQHLAFNKKLISLAADPKIVHGWTGDKKYGEELFKKFDNIFCRPVIYKEKYNLKEALRRYIHIFKIIRKTNEAERIFFLSFDNTLFPVFCLLFHKSLSRKKMFCVIHNNLKTLNETPAKKRLFRILSSFIKIEYVVLTESMKALADSILNTSTILFHHPFYEIKSKRAGQDGKNFLVIGRHGIGFYNSLLYRDFIAACNESPHGYKIKMVIIVKTGVEEIRYVKEDSIEVNVISGFLSIYDYQQYFHKTAFVIFPESDESQYRASGTLIDTLSTGGIFIAPETGHYKEFQGCGIFYRKGDLKKAVNQALNLSENEIESMRNNIEKKRREYEQENQQVLKRLLI
jgi:hypothetical protein